MPKSKVQVKHRKNVPPLKHNRSYVSEFDSLSAIGDAFELKGKSVKYGSIRTQASKQGKRRGIVYQVSKQKHGVIVRLASYISTDASPVE